MYVLACLFANLFWGSLKFSKLGFHILIVFVLQIISPYNLYLNPTLVVKQYQYWRLVTNFLYFRKMGNFPLTLLYETGYNICVLITFIWSSCLCHIISSRLLLVNSVVTDWLLINKYVFGVVVDLDFMFHMFFLARYCKLLEENSFRGKTADFLYMLLFGASVLTGIVLIGGMIPYLSASFAKIIFLSNSLTFMMVGNFCFPQI